MKIRFAFAAAAVAATMLGSGCAVYMAATQPDKKNLSLLSQGQPRANLIAEFGTPVHTEMQGGVRKDIFKFVNGYSTEEKAGRAVLHGAADVVTLGLWEAVGTPVEGYANGNEISAEVTYDADDRVASVVPLKGADTLAERDRPRSAEAPNPIETGGLH